MPIDTPRQCSHRPPRPHPFHYVAATIAARVTSGPGRSPHGRPPSLSGPTVASIGLPPIWTHHWATVEVFGFHRGSRPGSSHTHVRYLTRWRPARPSLQPLSHLPTRPHSHALGPRRLPSLHRFSRAEKPPLHPAPEPTARSRSRNAQLLLRSGTPVTHIRALPNPGMQRTRYARR